ncbi:MAG: MarR family transcriptional regulator [Candidatus Methanofastidiosia archaeon]
MWIILFLLLAVQTAGYTVDVSETGYAVISHELVITAEEDMDVYSYVIPFPITHLEVYSDKTVQGEFTVLGTETQITLHVSLQKGESAYLVPEYYSWDIIHKEGAEWWLYLPSTEEGITVLMPEGATISYMVTDSPFPQISEEDGKITLFWDELPSNVYVYYEISLNSQNTVNWTWGVVLGVVGAAGVVLYMSRRLLTKRKHKAKPLNKAVLSVLNERELQVVEYLHEKGRSRQIKIARACDIPKTSLSKLLMRMEERGIIRREKDGNFTYCELDENALE